MNLGKCQDNVAAHFCDWGNPRNLSV